MMRRLLTSIDLANAAPKDDLYVRRQLAAQVIEQYRASLRGIETAYQQGVRRARSLRRAANLSSPKLHQYLAIIRERGDVPAEDLEQLEILISLMIEDQCTIERVRQEYRPLFARHAQNQKFSVIAAARRHMISSLHFLLGFDAASISDLLAEAGVQLCPSRIYQIIAMIRHDRAE